MAATGSSAGKRAGARRGARPKRTLSPRIAILALGITVLVIAWGYLVYSAIDFGTDARGGDSRAWGFLALTAVGAVACLFAGLMLVARLSRALGLTTGPSPRTVGEQRPAEVADTGAPAIDGSSLPSMPSSSPLPPSHRHRAD